MHIRLDYSPGFTATLFRWEATLVVEGRGSVGYSAYGFSGREERRRVDCELPLDLGTFERVYRDVMRLSEVPMQSHFEDVPVRRLFCQRSEGAEIVCTREVDLAFASKRRLDRHRVDFDRIWFELFTLVRPFLVDLGVSHAILRSSC